MTNQRSPRSDREESDREETATDPAGLECSARFWMRAYPRRWRAFYGDDLVGVLADVAEPGARWVPAREAAQIVHAGWALRLRERPPFWKWLRYRIFGFQLPSEYRSWVIDDLLGKFFILRVGMPVSGILLGWFLAFSEWRLPSPFPAALVASYVLVLGVVWLLRRVRARFDWRRYIGTEPPIELQPWRNRRRAYSSAQT